MTSPLKTGLPKHPTSSKMVSKNGLCWQSLRLSLSLQNLWKFQIQSQKLLINPNIMPSLSSGQKKEKFLYFDYPESRASCLSAPWRAELRQHTPFKSIPSLFLQHLIFFSICHFLCPGHSAPDIHTAFSSTLFSTLTKYYLLRKVYRLHPN